MCIEENFNCKMVLLEDNVLRLDYDPSTDIVVVEYPDLHSYLLPEIKQNIDKMVEVIRNYDIKHLLLDSTRTLSSVNKNESREVALYFAAGIMKTQVQKVARVRLPVETVEEWAQGTMEHIQQPQLQPLPFQLQDFSVKTKALEWLTQ